MLKIRRSRGWGVINGSMAFTSIPGWGGGERTWEGQVVWRWHSDGVGVRQVQHRRAPQGERGQGGEGGRAGVRPRHVQQLASVVPRDREREHLGRGSGLGLGTPDLYPQ